jgi:hypothetical protein
MLSANAIQHPPFFILFATALSVLRVFTTVPDLVPVANVIYFYMYVRNTTKNTLQGD